MNFQSRKQEKVFRELGLVNIDGGAVAQSCASLKKCGSKVSNTCVILHYIYRYKKSTPRMETQTTSTL